MPGEQRHARAAVELADAHAIDVHFLHAFETRDRLRDFGGGDVFAFPAVGVTETIDELGVAEADVAQHVVKLVVFFVREGCGEHGLSGSLGESTFYLQVPVSIRQAILLNSQYDACEHLFILKPKEST